MKPKIVARYILLSILFGFFFARFIDFDLEKIWPIIVATIFAIVIILVVFRDPQLILMGISIISVIIATSYARYRADLYQPAPEVLKQTKITGVVVSDPELDQKQKFVLRINDQGKSVFIQVFAERFPEYSYGDRLEIYGEVVEPGNFSDFNYKEYLRAKDIYLMISQPERIELVERRPTIIGRLYSIRKTFERSLNQIYPEPEASFAAGLILGSRRGLPESLTESMRATGTSHLVAISGYNVTIVIVALSTLLLLLGRRLAFSLTVLIVIGFIILTGGSASVVRGGIVALLVLLARTIDRRADQTNILLLSAVGILAFNPKGLFSDVGFLLSYSSFAGLIYLAEPLAKFFSKNRLLSRIPEFTSTPLRETLAAQIMTFPLLLFVFGQSSLIAPISNLLILPLIPSIMLLIFIAGIFGLISLPVAFTISAFSWPILHFPIFIIKNFAELPITVINFGRQSEALLIIAYLIIIISLIIFNRWSEKQPNSF
jgi:competence protein ComEC